MKNIQNYISAPLFRSSCNLRVYLVPSDGISESDPVVGVPSDESSGDSAGEPTGALAGPGIGTAEFAAALAAAALTIAYSQLICVRVLEVFGR